MQFLLFLPLILFAGCATTYGDMMNADTLCANNGGVSHIQGKYNKTVHVICNNGAKFKLTAREVNL